MADITVSERACSVAPIHILCSEVQNKYRRSKASQVSNPFPFQLAMIVGLENQSLTWLGLYVKGLDFKTDAVLYKILPFIGSIS